MDVPPRVETKQLALGLVGHHRQQLPDGVVAVRRLAAVLVPGLDELAVGRVAVARIDRDPTRAGGLLPTLSYLYRADRWYVEASRTWGDIERYELARIGDTLVAARRAIHTLDLEVTGMALRDNTGIIDRMEREEAMLNEERPELLEYNDARSYEYDPTA